MLTALVGVCWMAAQGDSRPANSTASGSASATSASASAPVTITLACYNVNYGLTSERDLADVVAIIRKSQADVVAIQEGSNALRAELRKNLAKEYPHMKLYEGTTSSGFAWLSKFPLEKAGVLLRKHGWFDTPMAQVTVGGRTIQLANIHLYPTSPPRGAKLADMMRLLEKTNAIRAKEIRYILENLPASLPAVMMGDFNALSSFDSLRFLRAQGWFDSLAQVTDNPDAMASWHWTTDDSRQWAFRIDYIWHTGHFKTLASRIIPEGPSDHYPVVSRLVWVGGAASPRGRQVLILGGENAGRKI